MNVPGSRAVEAAKSALRRNSYADFGEQAPHIQLLLENLPVLRPDDPALQSLPADKAARWSLNEVMDYLAGEWIASHSPHSHEGAIHAEIADEPDLLVAAFHMYLWSVTTEVLRITVARIAGDTFLCWVCRQSRRYEMPRSRSTIKARPRRGLPGLGDRVLEWMQSQGWMINVVEVIVYAVVFGIVGVVVGAILGAIWGMVAGGLTR